MKLLVIGARGQLGAALTRESRRVGFFTAAADIPEVDITDEGSIRRLVEDARPDLVVNAAAYTAVDAAEDHPEAAFAVNRDGPGHLAGLCATARIPLVHISTDYVFDGNGNRPYDEQAPVSPLGVYARSKAEGEAAVRNRLTEHLILRTSWLFGAEGNNFVKAMLRIGKRETTVRVVADQIGCPTSAEDLAGAILQLAGRVVSDPGDGWGTYHFCNRGATTWHGFAEAIFALARGRCPLRVATVVPITTAEFGAAAPRPAFSVLSCERIARQFGIVPRPWQAALADTLDAILSRETEA
ncbi:MAG: dTDP-4-dehydrorhamnose reductase [Desulfobacterales bacterium]